MSKRRDLRPKRNSHKNVKFPQAKQVIVTQLDSPPLASNQGQHPSDAMWGSHAPDMMWQGTSPLWGSFQKLVTPVQPETSDKAKLQTNQIERPATKYPPSTAQNRQHHEKQDWNCHTLEETKKDMTMQCGMQDAINGRWDLGTGRGH